MGATGVKRRRDPWKLPTVIPSIASFLRRNRWMDPRCAAMVQTFLSNLKTTNLAMQSTGNYGARRSAIVGKKSQTHTLFLALAWIESVAQLLWPCNDACRQPRDAPLSCRPTCTSCQQLSHGNFVAILQRRIILFRFDKSCLEESAERTRLQLRAREARQARQARRARPSLHKLDRKALHLDRRLVPPYFGLLGVSRRKASSLWKRCSPRWRMTANEPDTHKI